MKIRKTLLITILITTMLFTTTTTYAAVNIDEVKDTLDSVKETLSTATTMIADAFTDIKNSDWFYESVKKMTEQGIFKGYLDGTFKPNKTISNAEFIKMFVVSVTGEDLGTSDTGHWALNYYNKGIELGLYTEYDIMESDLDNNIPRKLMAFMVSNNFYGTEIESYDQIEESITDLDEGKPYQHEIIKSYGMGILTGYEDGTFKPNNTLTRAESATVINRILNENERQIPEFDETAKADKDAYWKEDKQYDEIAEWIADNQNGAVWGGHSSLEDGKIYFTHSDGYKWSADSTNYSKLHEHIYLTLKAYYDYAIEHDMGLFIGGDENLNEITIGLRQNDRTTSTLFYFGFEGTPEYLDDVWVDVPNYVRPYVFYSPRRYFTDADSKELGNDLLLERERIGDDSLVELNREIFQMLYGKETGSKIMDYAVKIYKDSFDVETKEMVDLPNPKVTIDGIDIYYNDDSSYDAFYLDQPK